MYTIRQLAQLYNLSRSTLIYYDKIGLLPPATRSVANYRLYDESARNRLSEICQLRETGLSLSEIKAILKDRKSKVGSALELRLKAINEDIHSLRVQQHQIVTILQQTVLQGETHSMDKKRWVDLLRQSGFSKQDMAEWHRNFETHSPDDHQKFLQSIGIPKAEIAMIRKASMKEK